MSETTRREMLGTVGTLAAAAGLGMGSDAVGQQPGPAGGPPYTLPPLPYPYDALEPHIDAQTMTLHHDKHHAAYVKGLNDALTALAEVDSKGGQDVSHVRALTDAVAFNGSGHVLHSMFWTNMHPGGGEPAGPLADRIKMDFSSPEAFRARFSATAAQVQGGGWAVLAWEPLGQRLVISGIEKHQNCILVGSIPLLVLDVWEHAYYLKYQNRRPDFIKAWWNVVNWDNVSQRLGAAQTLRPQT